MCLLLLCALALGVWGSSVQDRVSQLEQQHQAMLETIAVQNDQLQTLKTSVESLQATIDSLASSCPKALNDHPNDNELGSRTIHFMYGLWDTTEMSAEFKANKLAWMRLNPGWSFKVWNASEIKQLWKKEFPEYRDLWKQTRPIQRADIARLMVVLKYGGIYADLDCAPTKPIDDIFFTVGFRRYSHHTVLCVEDIKTEAEMRTSASWPIRQGIPEHPTRIANYVFFAAPDSPLLKRALALAASRVRNTPSIFYQAGNGGHNPYAIIYTTGPDVLTDVTFKDEKGLPIPNPAANGVLVIDKGKCHMNNLATGTWIGDQNPASELVAQKK
eukprot:m.58504 g.58504  ORF g.58504 m.58504 type:complete len:329 (+) comp19017_c0_seq1:135-1121(+)